MHIHFQQLSRTNIISANFKVGYLDASLGLDDTNKEML